jgi:P pilus assembly chaperone PapD
MTDLSKKLVSRLRRSLSRTVVFWLVLLLPVLPVSAGVLVSPTVVFVSDKNPTGRMTLHNPTDIAQEVNIKFSFGLPVSNSFGKLVVAFQDSAVTDPRSALEWVKAFPRKVIVAPNESQTVRIMVRPPANLPDGEYWARVMVRSKNANQDIPAAAQDQIATHLTMVTEMAIMLKYRTGELFSNLELSSANATVLDSAVEVWLDMANLGNVSYMGVLKLALKDSDGKLMNEFRTNLAVYRTQKRRLELAIPEGEFKPPYQVVVNISSEERNDIDDRDLIAGNKIELDLAAE